jgi:hypothetical protein
MHLKRVRQRHKFGCFVASVAIALGVSYAEARKRLYPKKVASGRRFNPGFGGSWDLFRALRRAGLRVRNVPKQKIVELTKPTIIILHWAGYDTGHCAVWDPEKKAILDPAYDPPLPMYEYDEQLVKLVSFTRREA